MSVPPFTGAPLDGPRYYTLGVPRITPEMLVRIYGDEEACPDCVIEGAPCDECAAQPDVVSLRAVLVVTVAAWGVLAFVAGAVWALFNG